MGSLGMPEILIILVIALIIFGPRKLPELGKTLGQSLAQFRRASEDFKRQWEDEVVMERHRIESPAPAPVEHESYFDSAPASPDGEQVHTNPLDEPSHIPDAAESTVAASHEGTAVKETKHDWM